MFAAFASLALLLASPARAGLYFTNPVQSSTGQGDKTVTVQWVDDGVSPLVSQIGSCAVGLYNGNLNLVQSLPTTDVSTTSSLTFTVNADAGANGPYYLVFSSQSIAGYQAYTASFALTDMSGTTPSGGSSTPVSTDSSASAASSNPGASPTDTGADTDTTSGTGTSAPVAGTTAPIDTTAAPDTTAATSTPTVAVPTVTTTGTTTTTSSKATTTKTSATSTAAATSGAGRVESSMSLVTALLALSGFLAF